MGKGWELHLTNPSLPYLFPYSSVISPSFLISVISVVKSKTPSSILSGRFYTEE